MISGSSLYHHLKLWFLLANHLFRVEILKYRILQCYFIFPLLCAFVERLMCSKTNEDWSWKGDVKMHYIDLPLAEDTDNEIFHSTVFCNPRCWLTVSIKTRLQMKAKDIVSEWLQGVCQRYLIPNPFSNTLGLTYYVWAIADRWYDANTSFYRSFFN